MAAWHFGLNEEEIKYVRPLFIIVLLELVSLAMLIPILPFFLIDEIGLGPADVGLILSIFSGAQLIGQWILGRLSDTFGRAPMLLIAFAFLGVGFLGLAFVQTLTHVIIVRCIQGVSGGVSPCIQAYMLDIVPKEKQPTLLGLSGGVAGLAFICGPILGGLLVWVEVPRRTIFVICACLSLLGTLYGIWLLPESLPMEKRRPLTWADSSGFDIAVVNVGVCLVWIAKLLTQLAQATLFTTYAFLIKYLFDWADMEFGIVLVCAGLTGALVQMFLFPLACKYFDWSTILGVGCFFGMISFLLYPQESILLHVLAILFFALGGACTEPTVPLLVGRFIPDSYLGFGNGVAEATGSLGQVFGPLLASALYEKKSPQYAYYVGAAIFASAGAVGFLTYTQPGIEQKGEGTPLVRDKTPRETA
jgi:DHA1 family tetracycline resistance protein-like MFS transporter